MSGAAPHPGEIAAEAVATRRAEAKARRLAAKAQEEADATDVTSVPENDEEKNA